MQKRNVKSKKQEGNISHWQISNFSQKPSLFDSIISCFLVYVLFLSNFSFVAGELFLDNDSTIQSQNNSQIKILENITENTTQKENNLDLKGNFNETNKSISEKNLTEINLENITLEHSYNDSTFENNSNSSFSNNTYNFSDVDFNYKNNFTENNSNFSLTNNLNEKENNLSIPEDKIFLKTSNSSLLNESFENLSEEDFRIETIQLPAKVGEKVSWIKRVYGAPKELKIQIPKEGREISSLNSPKYSIERINSTLESQFREIYYETPAPLIETRNLKNKKEVLISSEYHYENVSAEVTLDFDLRIEEKDKLNLFWKEENKFLDFNVLDENNDSFIDKISWIVPHLSNQTFEIFIDVLTVQSYPIVGGEWKVEFETSGMANLLIKGINGTYFGEDLDFLELKCGDKEIDYQSLENGIFVENYSCEETSFEISKVLSSGKHDLEFKFGDSIDFAHNFAGKVGYKTQSGIYNLVGLDEFIPLESSVNTSATFLISPNMMNQENVTPATNGDPATNSDDSFVALSLYNSTHLRAQRSASDDGPVIVTWQILEAMDGEFSVQRGKFDYSGSATSVNTTIPFSVDKDYSMSWFYINTSYDKNNGDVIQFYSDLIDNNTIKFTREHSGTSTSVSFSWEVVEWNKEKINNFLKGYTGAITGSSDSPDCFLLPESINKSSSILLHQSHAINDNDGGLDTSTRAGYIQNDNYVCFYDYGGIYTAGVKWYLIDFIGSTQREENIHTAWASEDYRDDVPFSQSYSESNSLFWLSGTCNGDGTAKPRHTQWWEFNSTGFNVQRTYGGQNREYSWQVLELPYYENLDWPTISNFALNKSYAKESENVRFSLDVFDSSNEIDYVIGTIAGENYTFNSGTGNEWFYDYSCSSEEEINFTDVYVADKGYPVNKNYSSVNGINLICDFSVPEISLVSPPTPLNSTNSNGDSIEIGTNFFEEYFYRIVYWLYNSTGLVDVKEYFSEINNSNFSSLKSDTYYFNVSVEDLAGNINSTETRKIILDNDEAIISFGEGVLNSGAFSKGDSIFVNVSVLEAHEENITFNLYNELGEIERTNSFYDARRNVNWTLLEDGFYYYNVSVWDSFGNLGFSETRNITLENILPAIEFIPETKNNNSFVSNDWIFLNISVAEDNFKNITFELYNSSSKVYSDFFNDSTRSVNWTGLSDDEYYYNVSVYDLAGNFNVSETRKITLDKLAPQISYGLGVEENNANFSRDWVFVNVSVAEDNFKNITFNLYQENNLIDSISFTQKTLEYNFSDLDSGNYFYNVTVHDLAGNFNYTETRKIGLDVYGPTITILEPEMISYGNGTGMDLIHSVSDNLIGVEACWWNLDGGENQSILCNSATTFNADDGTHTINFYANDSFGNLGFEDVSFFVSTTGPAILLDLPKNDTFYNSASQIYFNYSVNDPDRVDSCSLFGNFNGTWKINQTDYSFGLIGDDTPRSCADEGAVSCGEPETGVPFDSCASTYNSRYEYVNNVYLSDTEVVPGQSVEVTCEFTFDSSDDIYIWYYNGTGWKEVFSQLNQGSGGTENRSTTFRVDDVIGNHIVRCGITWNTDSTEDFCANGGTNYFDNDDLNFSVVKEKKEGNFSLNLSAEENYLWNVGCNDTLGYFSTSFSNNTFGFDFTTPIVEFGPQTSEDFAKKGQDWIYVDANVTEENLKNITFNLFDNSNVLIKNNSFNEEIFEINWTGLEDGTYYYNVSVYDKAGWSSNSLTREIELETVLPTGTLISPSSNSYTKNPEQNLTANISDGGGLDKAILFIKNSTGTIIYSATKVLGGALSATVGLIYTFLTSDVFSWFYQVEDVFGNKFNTTSNNLIVDFSLPKISFISPTKEDNSVVKQNWIYVNTNVLENNFKNITFNLYKESTKLYSNSFVDSTRSINWTLLSDGNYFYNVTVWDKAGNVNVSETRKITLDNTNPVVNFAPNSWEDEKVVSGNGVFVNTSVVEPNEANITFRLYNELGGIVRQNTYSDLRRSITWTLLSEGNYFYNVSVRDKVNNLGVSSTREVRIDNTPPILNFGNGVENSFVNKSRNWIFVNASVVENNLKNITFYLYNSSELVREDTFGDGTLSINWTNLEDGIYWYNMSVYDKAGFSDESSTRQITLDTQKPLIVWGMGIEEDWANFSRDWVFSNVSFYDDNFKEIKFGIFREGELVEEKVFENLTQEYNFSQLSSGIYNYNVSVYDWAGNFNSTSTKVIGLDTSGPTIIISRPESKAYSYNTSLPLNYSVNDNLVSVESCWWNLDGITNESITCGTNTTFDAGEGGHIINFYANDSFGNVGFSSKSFSISTKGPATELISPINDSFYSLPTEVNFSFRSFDPDGIESCALWGDWGTDWHEEENYSGTWFDFSWRNRKNVSIKNIANVSFEDYSFYLNVSSNYTYSGDFSDLRFFNGSCSEEQNVSLPFYIEHYDSNSADVWIKLTNLQMNSTEICMYYGNENAESGENISNVWDEDYLLVYDMSSDGVDLSSNANNIASVVGTPISDNSFLGYGKEFGLGNAWDMTNVGIWESEWFNRSQEIVFKTGSDVNTRQVLLAEGGGTNGYMMYILNGYLYARWWSENSGFSGDYIFTPVSANQIYYAVSSYQYPGNYTLYLNGDLIDTRVSVSEIRAHTGDGGIAYTGSSTKDFHDITSSGHYFLGSIFDLKVSDEYRTNEWLNQTYASIFEKYNLNTYGNEENFKAFNLTFSDEGIYNWNIKCVDNVGWNSFALENYSFSVDVTNPVVMFGSGSETDNEIVGRNWVYVDANVMETNFKNITFRLYNSLGQVVKTSSFTDNTRNVNWTGLNDDFYDYNITVYDKAGRSGVSPTRTIKLDTLEPSGNLLSPADFTYTNSLLHNLTASFSDNSGLLNAILFIFNSTGSLVNSTSISLNGGFSQTVGIIYNFIKAGIYSWFYQVEDVVGNKYNLTSNEIIVDLTPPKIWFEVGVEESASVFERDWIFVNASSSDSYFSNMTFRVFDENKEIILGGEWSVYENSSEILFENLDDGFYYYNVTAMDLAGNINSTETRNISLDNTNPVVEYSSGTKDNGKIISGDEIFVNVSVIEPNFKNITFNLYDDQNQLVKKNSFSDSTRSITWNLLTDGIYYYNVSVYDVLGHKGTTQTRNIEIDNSFPTIQFIASTDVNNANRSRDWIYVYVNVTEKNFANITFELYNSSSKVYSDFFNDSTRSVNWTGLSDDEYYYNVSVYDLAGNFNVSETRKITLDKLAPQISYGLGVEENNANFSRDWVFVNVSVAEDNFKNITFNLYDSFGKINSKTFSNSSRTYNFSSLDSKEYYYNVSVYDWAGNFNVTETRKIGLDYLGPEINLINPKSKAYGTNVSLPLDYSVSDNIVGIDACWYNLDNGDNVSVDCESSSTFNSSDGEHTLYFYSNDSFGNVGNSSVTFLISVTGPAIQLYGPEDNSFYSQSEEIFFNYSAEDPDLTQSCSLWGSWNGGWHLNQTDFDWEVRDFSDRTCSEVWGFDCGAGPAESSDNTFDECANGVGSDESVENIYLSDTIVVPGQEINVTCEFDPYTSDDDLFIWYYNGTGWRKLYEEYNAGSSSNINRSVSFLVDEEIGEQWVRCGIIYMGSETDDECTDDSTYSTDYFDNDDINFTVVEPKTQGNFTLNLSEEGTHDWNVECNDSLGYYTWAVSNYSLTFDVTNPIVEYSFDTLEDNSNVSQDWIFMNVSVVENNFENITFFIYNETEFLDSDTLVSPIFNYNFTDLDDGKYYYNVSVYDKAGRRGDSLTRTILLDTQNPTGTLTGPNNGVYVKNSTQNLTANVEDETGLKKAILFIFNQTGLVDSFNFDLNTKNAILGKIYTFVQDGIYNWFYQVEDLVGNKYNITSNQIVVDTTLPHIDFSDETAENNSFVAQDFIYLNTSLIEENFKNITYELFSSSQRIYSNPFSTYKSSINWTNLEDGVYFYNVTVWDKAGNVNASETRKITLDNVAPVFSYSIGTEINGANKSQNWIYVNTSLVEENLDNITYRLYNEEGLLDQEIFYNYTTEFNWTEFSLMENDDYWYNVSVYDKSGLKKDLLTRKITLDLILPLVDFGLNTEVNDSTFERDWVHVSSNVVETHFKNISYTLYDENMQILNKTTFNLLVPNINFSVSGENNSYFYDILVYDWAGNFKVSNLRKINLIDVTNPTLTIVSPQNKTYSYNEGIRLDYNAFDPHLDSCWYNLDGGENISLANCQNSVLNVEDESSHTLELFVNDTLGYMNSSSVTFFVNSSLIETPTYKILRGTTFVDGYSEETIEVTDMSKSFILHTSRSADSGPDSLQVIGDFVNSNKVSFENYDSGESAIVDWSIISGPDIKVQRGEIEFSNEKNLSSQINSVNLSNSFIIVNSKLNTGDASKNTDGFFISKFLDNSTIYFERGSNYSSGVLSWQVVSWSSANVQSGNSNILSGSVESGNVLIDSVNLNNSFLIFSKNIVGDNSVGDSMIEGKMVDNSNIEFNRRLNGGNVSLEFFVVSSELFNVQSGTYTHLLNSDEQTIGLDNDLVDIQRSFDIHSNENDGIATSFASAFVTQNILDTQNLVLQKGLGSGAGETSWFAVEILDVSNPVVNLNSPINNYNYSSHNLGQFSFVVEDETNISNCSLWGSWNGGWHLNQTISDVSKEVTNYFDSFSVNESGFYSWKVVCRDVYANSGESLNYTFSSYLPPSEPEFVNITQSSNDGLGNITLDWEESNDTVKYKIYAGEDLNNLVLIDEVNQSNYTDSSFAGQKRKFYRIEAWNPSAVNMTNYIFGAHVYELKQNQSSEYSIKNRNWIGFPTNYLGIEKAKDVLDEVDAITTMTRLNPVTQKRVSCTEFSCPESYACTETACNFDLQAGEGYEVLLNESGEENLNWSAVGLVQEPVQITLVYNENGAVFNNNWISMYAGTVLEDASDLSGSLLGEDAITSWNIDEQKSEGWNYVCLPWNPAVCFWMGEDFKINPEGAYEVSVTQDSMWTQI